ncbi:translation initiation factor eIF-1A [Methanotorris igneus]|uniref:Translation initiation factor 1A n=1 Tax=Methanotorris igneus (strain DSM 5666 / JCM 11834 / Kol 5) TaxID=880724 RepID=F6BC92_METIK|nr:translation initiation factor eIF-1A [Methanotorris igneus]AEF97298.1 Translation initiation factor 1A [Methanotorris igneus Kol 5]
MQQQEQPIRVRIPKPEENEILGIVEQMLGASRVRVRCMDGKTRLGRIPGKLKKRIWIREGDVVIVVPWEVQGDEKCDIVWRYTKTQVEWLTKHGYLNQLL